MLNKIIFNILKFCLYFEIVILFPWCLLHNKASFFIICQNLLLPYQFSDRKHKFRTEKTHFSDRKTPVFRPKTTISDRKLNSGGSSISSRGGSSIRKFTVSGISFTFTLRIYLLVNVKILAGFKSKKRFYCPKQISFP